MKMFVYEKLIFLSVCVHFQTYAMEKKEQTLFAKLPEELFFNIIFLTKPITETEKAYDAVLAGKDIDYRVPPVILLAYERFNRDKNIAMSFDLQQQLARDIVLLKFIDEKSAPIKRQHPGLISLCLTCKNLYSMVQPFKQYYQDSIDLFYASLPKELPAASFFMYSRAKKLFAPYILHPPLIGEDENLFFITSVFNAKKRFF